MKRADLIRENARLRAALEEIARVASPEGIATTTREREEFRDGRDVYPWTVGWVGAVAENALRREAGQ